MLQKLTVPSNETLISNVLPQPELVDRIVELIETGDSKFRESIGAHGTTVHGILHCIETGVFPGGRIEGTVGDLYFYPFQNPSLVLPDGFVPRKENSALAIEGAANYAADLSRHTLALHMLGLDLADDVHWQLGYHFRAGGFSAAACNHIKEHEHSFPPIPERKIVSVDRALGRTERGFVLLLGESALKNDPVQVGDLGEGDVRLCCLNGLDIKDIVGIVPVHQQDRCLIESLKAKCRDV